MILNKKGQKFNYNDIIFIVGEKIIANENSAYNGLIGIITEIRNGLDKDTDNETPDIYCSFNPPSNDYVKKEIEKRFTVLYGIPLTIDDINLEEVIMAPEMLRKEI